MKRFYKVASTQKSGNRNTIVLDGRTVKTQSGAPLCAPTQKLAEAVMLEWAGQGDNIIPETMPLTQMLNTKIDRIHTDRDTMRDNVLKYLNTDLLCYQTDEPEDLSKRQKDCWGRWLKWFEHHYGHPLEVTTGLSVVQHSEDVHTLIQKEIRHMDDDHFNVLQVVTVLSGSLVLALAFQHGAANAQDVFEAHYLEELFKDELYNAEKYGSDPILEKAQKSAMTDLKAAALYLKLLNDD